MRPFGLVLYRTITQRLTPLAPRWLNRRAKAGKEDALRLGERLGKATERRPDGLFVWLHGASVGEADLALTLIEALSAAHDGTQFLLTTGTRTSAGLVAARMGKNTRHQYLPLDFPEPVQQFLSHWHPDVGIFMESELWPNLILAAKNTGMRLALVSARMNAWSLRRWQNVPSSAGCVLDAFDWIGTADAHTRAGLARLTKNPCTMTGNLKLAAPPPQADAPTLARLADDFGSRQVWLGLSTHRGEDEILMAAHQKLRQHHDGAILLLVPRHPERAAHLALMAEHFGFSHARYSDRNAPKSAPDVYLGDSIGDMGLWLRLGSPAVIGGSLISGLRGHNPLDAANLNVPVLCGPYRTSFTELYDDLHHANAMIEVRNANDIANAVGRLWHNPERAKGYAKAAYAQARKNAKAPMEMTLKALKVLLEGKT